MTIPVPSHRAPAFAAISAGALVALSCVGLAFSGPDISVGHKVAPAMGGRALPDDAGLALGETAPAGRDVRVVLASPFGPAPPGAAKPGFRPAVEAKASPEPASLTPAAAAPADLASGGAGGCGRAAAVHPGTHSGPGRRGGRRGRFGRRPQGWEIQDRRAAHQAQPGRPGQEAGLQAAPVPGLPVPVIGRSVDMRWFHHGPDPSIAPKGSIKNHATWGNVIFPVYVSERRTVPDVNRRSDREGNTVGHCGDQRKAPSGRPGRGLDICTIL